MSRLFLPPSRAEGGHRRQKHGRAVNPIRRVRIERSRRVGNRSTRPAIGCNAENQEGNTIALDPLHGDLQNMRTDIGGANPALRPLVYDDFAREHVPKRTRDTGGLLRVGAGELNLILRGAQLGRKRAEPLGRLERAGDSHALGQRGVDARLKIGRRNRFR